VASQVFRPNSDLVAEALGKVSGGGSKHFTLTRGKGQDPGETLTVTFRGRDRISDPDYIDEPCYERGNAEWRGF